jgi:hypothetical protein
MVFRITELNARSAPVGRRSVRKLFRYSVKVSVRRSRESTIESHREESPGAGGGTGCRRPLVARGTGNETRRLSRHVSNGAGAYLIVTPRRLLWSPLRNTHCRVSLDFDTVTSWFEGTQYHRYALVLRHAAVERIGWAPAHRVLWFEWGNTEVTKRQTQTILHFSRPDTEVASGIREQLLRRKIVPGEPLEFDEQSREERNQGAVMLARRRWRNRFRS